MSSRCNYIATKTSVLSSLLIRGMENRMSQGAGAHAKVLLNTIRDINKMGAWSDLKKVNRAGWKRAGISDRVVESVAEHSLKLAEIASRYAILKGLDAEKLIKMSLVHDLPEAVVGDITPRDHIPVKEKHKAETFAMKVMMKAVPNGNEYLSCFMEYQLRKSKESKLMHQLDKLEMVITALKYIFKYPQLDDLDGFVRCTEGYFRDHFVKNEYKELERKFIAWL